MIKALYVHIPFCNNICGYCDFVKRKYEEKLCDNYLDQLEKDLNKIEQSSFFSGYIGGGTPTSLNNEQLERLLKMLSKFNFDVEYTIEINPDSFTLEKAKLLEKYKINRVSIGVQSFNDELLSQMGRKHKKQDIFNTLSYLDEANIKNRSIDLIYGFKNQTIEQVGQDLQQAIKLDITHISIYGLEIYENTIFGKQKYQKMDEDNDYLCYKFIREFLNENGFIQYETSNFAKEGYQSNHNKVYWHYDNYLGVGCGASSKISNYRIDNERNILKYISNQSNNERIELSQQDIIFEAIMMNLRLLEGININDFNNKFNCDLLKDFEKPINKNIKKKLLELNDGYLKPTVSGVVVLNDILVDFMN